MAKSTSKTSPLGDIQNTFPFNYIIDVLGWPNINTDEDYRTMLESDNVELLTIIGALRIIECDSGLTDREKRTVILYYRDKKSFKEIGNELNVTPVRAKEIWAKALRRSRHPGRIRKYGVVPFSNCSKYIKDTTDIS